MDVRIVHTPVQEDGVVTCLFLFSGDKKLPISWVHSDIRKKIESMMAEGEFKGAKNELLYLSKQFAGTPVILVGLGEKKSLDLHTWKRAVGVAVKQAQSKKVTRLQVFIPAACAKKLSLKRTLTQTIVSLGMASYQFNSYISDNEVKMPAITDAYIVSEQSATKQLSEACIKEGFSIVHGVNFARELGNLPPLEMTPAYLAHEAEKLGETYKKMKVTVFGEDQIIQERMGALHGVSLGSSLEPKFIIMEWKNAPKSSPSYVFAGKAITFDTGGISIKPSAKMDEMKFDMMGGAAVFGAMKAIAEMNLKVNVVGLVPAAENKPGERAFCPGDILRARNGKTIEVLNTDAEGRLILADALSYASEYKPKLAIDLATLTGACVAALGDNYAAGLFTTDEKAAQSLAKASNAVAERLWRLPLDDQHREDMRSKVADIKNIGGSRYGGASQAAAFLEAFTDYPWAHIDIAPVMQYADAPDAHPGARGFGVQILVELAKTWSKR